MSKSLPDDFDAWWNTPGEWVEAPNEARSGWSGMMRIRLDGKLYYVKKQRNYLCRTLRHPFGWPTTSREFRNLMWLQVLGIGVPATVFHGTRRTAKGLEAILVTEELEGFTDLAAQQHLSPGRRAELASTVGHIVGRLHRAGFQHGCLYDKHIMVRWEGDRPRVALIDLEKLRRAVFRKNAIQHDLRQLKRRQRLWNEAEWSLLTDAHRHALDDAPARQATA